MLSEHQRRIDLLMKTLCVSAEVPFQTGDNMEVAKMGIAALKQQDVVSCKIEDSDHNVLFWNGQPDTNHGRWISDTVFTAYSRMDKKTGTFAMENKPNGFISLKISYAEVRNALKKIKRSVYLLSLAVLALQLGISTLVTRFLLMRPIKQLIKGTSQNFQRESRLPGTAS